MVLRSAGPRSDEGRSAVTGRVGFGRLWAGQTASVFGTAISALALPTVAILGMHAPAFLVGVLEAAQFAAYPVLGLVAGVWIDRWSRRRTMLAADVVRGLLLCTVPLAAYLHVLSFAQLVAVALAVGAASVFFDVSYPAFVPSLVPASWLEHANARLEASNSVATLVGAGVAGALIGVLGAPLAVAVDAATYAVSATALSTIRVREAHRDARGAGRMPFRSALREGLATVFGSPVLRALVGATGCVNFGWSIVNAVYLLFLYRVLHFSPALVGALIACGNAGFAGALAAPRIARRFTAGRVMSVTLLLAVGVTFAIPLAAVFQPVAVILAVQLVVAICIPIYNVTQLSLRQRLVAPEQLGRVNATMKTMVSGVWPVGALIGGALGSTAGIVPTIWTGTVVMLAAVPFVFVRGIRALGRAPAHDRSEPTAVAR
jgi:predicted MFS family arabinose efflux permease